MDGSNLPNYILLQYQTVVLELHALGARDFGAIPGCAPTKEPCPEDPRHRQWNHYGGLAGFSRTSQADLTNL